MRKRRSCANDSEVRRKRSRPISGRSTSSGISGRAASGRGRIDLLPVEFEQWTRRVQIVDQRRIPHFAAKLAHLVTQRANLRREEFLRVSDQRCDAVSRVEQQADHRTAVGEALDLKQPREVRIPGQQIVGAVEQIGWKHCLVQFGAADVNRPRAFRRVRQRRIDDVAEQFEDVAPLGIVRVQRRQNPFERVRSG